MMLHQFKGLFIHEQSLDLHGRNRENVTAVRDVDDRAIWATIKRLAKIMERKWSRETKLGDAARYILRHFDELTVYLDDPRLAPTNNFAERMLRLEKLIEASSMFRASLAGRFVLDILRTVFQTAVAARAPLQEYVLSVLQADPDEVTDEPERFTPHAWVRAHGDLALASDIDLIGECLGESRDDDDAGQQVPADAHGATPADGDDRADLEDELVGQIDTRLRDDDDIDLADAVSDLAAPEHRIVDSDNIDRDLEDELANVAGGDVDNDADADEVNDDRPVPTDPPAGCAANSARKRSPPPRRSKKRSRKKRRRR